MVRTVSQPTRRALSIAVAACAVVGVLSVAGHTTPAAAQNPPETLAQVEAAVTAAETLTTVPSSAQAEITPNLTNASYTGPCLQERDGTSVNKNCAFGDTSSSTTVVLFGDSLAATWEPAMNWLGTTYGYKVVVVTRRNCPFAALPNSAYKDPGCSPWKKNAISYINSLHPSIVVFAEKNVGSAVDNTAPTASVSAFANDVKAGLNLVKTPKRVVIVGLPFFDAGSLGVDPGTCLSTILAESEPLTDCDTPVAKAFVPARLSADEKAIKQEGATWVSVTPLFCGTKNCPVVIGGNIAYSNQFHTPTWYSSWVANALGTIFHNANVKALD